MPPLYNYSELFSNGCPATCFLSGFLLLLSNENTSVAFFQEQLLKQSPLPVPLPSFKAYQAPLDLWPAFASNYYFGVAKKSTTRKFLGKKESLKKKSGRERESYSLPRSLLIMFTIITLFRMVTLLTCRRISSCRGTCVRISSLPFL